MTPEEVQLEILKRLTAIESTLALMNNPVRYVSIREKALTFKKALATGDKKIIKAAGKAINR